jgi:hypothetical protein
MKKFLQLSNLLRRLEALISESKSELTEKEIELLGYRMKQLSKEIIQHTEAEHLRRISEALHESRTGEKITS